MMIYKSDFWDYRIMKDEVQIIHNLEVIKPFQEQLERTQTSFKIPVQSSLKTLDLNHLKKKLD